MHEIRKIRRENMDKPVRQQKMREDDREERELRSYVAQSIANEMIHSMPGSINPQRGDEVKTPAERHQDATVQRANHQHMDPSGRR
jgi:peptide-N4-(N-acetyl-beta-glucosaminyl)asparagine amidase